MGRKYAPLHYSVTGVGIGIVSVGCTNSWRNSDCVVATFERLATNANIAHNIKNIAANVAVVLVRKFPAAAPVSAPPNIEAADEPDIPLPSDFCNKINPIIKTATIINITNKIENIFFPFSKSLVC